MDTKLITVIFHALLLSLFLHPETSGSPVQLLGKPPNCPHGKCFIDRCERICSCVPKEGNIHCTKEDFFLLFKGKLSMDCAEGAKQDGNCPLGETYKNPLWGENFLCNCNNDPSQTYECFDLSTQTSADYRDLVDSIKHVKQISNKVSNSVQKLK